MNLQNLNKHEVLSAYKELKRIEKSNIDQKVLVLRVYYFSFITALILLVIAILIS